MSNQFVTLDHFFPCGKERSCGEVVGVTVNFFSNGVFKGSMFWKRKAWYVNASKNAWHLHRGLCREFRTDYSKLALVCTERSVKGVLGRIVAYSYLRNYCYGDQYFSFNVELLENCPTVQFESPGFHGFACYVPIPEEELVRMYSAAYAFQELSSWSIK